MKANQELMMYHGEPYLLSWHKTTNFSNINHVNRAYGIIFTKKGKILLVSNDDQTKFTPPGGKPESYDKNLEETFIRETLEEANAELTHITPLGYIKVIPKSKNCKRQDTHYNIVFTAIIKKLLPRKKDPAIGIINKRKFIKPEEFITLTRWTPHLTTKQLQTALRTLRKINR